MAVNILGGRKQVVFAKVNVNIEDTPASPLNTRRITRYDGTPLSWDPSKVINGITAFEVGKGYIYHAIQDLDMSAYLMPPFSSGNAITWEDGSPITPE